MSHLARVSAAVALGIFAGSFSAVAQQAVQPVRDSGYVVVRPPIAYAYAPPILGGSQEQRGLVWLDNQRVMFLGFVPERPETKGIFVWDVVAGNVSQYSKHKTFCYADGYISAFGSVESDDPTGPHPLRHGPLGKERDESCGGGSDKPCRGRLNMSCQPAQYAVGSRPLGPESAVTLHLRSDDGALVVFSRGEGGSEEELKKRLSKPLVLLNGRNPKGVPLPITAIEGIGRDATSYSLYTTRYVFVPANPVDARPGRSTNWPKGRPQPIYLMTADGVVESIQIPSQPDWTAIRQALPAVPGLVFRGSGGPANAWGGVFLYAKQKLFVLDRGYTGTIAVSPDGCGVAYAIANDYFKKRGPQYEYLKSIRFCKGNAEKVNEALEHADRVQALRERTRSTVVQRYEHDQYASWSAASNEQEIVV